MNGRRALLGSKLHKLRTDAGLTQVELAEASGVAQTWISRIEGGRTLPAAKTIERLADALRLSAKARKALLAEVAELRAELAEWPSVAQEGMRRRQERILAIEASVAQIRVFQPAMIPGLLQIPSYMREVFKASGTILEATDVEEAVQARLARQQILFDLSKHFTFLLTEQALRWMLSPAGAMAAQTERLLGVLDQSNLAIGIIPFGRVVPLPPLNTFTLFADRLVLIEALDEVLTLRDEKDAALYRRMFDQFSTHALWGSETRPLLEKVRRRFLR